MRTWKRLIGAALFVCGFQAGAAAMNLSSPDLAEGQMLALPQVHDDCGGQDVAPSLAWSDPPNGTQSFAVTMFDPDAQGGWWHWVVYDIPAAVHALPRGGALPGSAVGRNDFGELAYGGACPPPGSGVHHYEITVWAMPTATLPIADPATDADIASYLQAHALAKATITPVYER